MGGMTEATATLSIAFIDIDNTLVRGATVYLVGLGAWHLKLLTARDVASFVWQQARFMAVGENMRHTETAKNRTLQMLTGHTEDELRRLGQEVYRRRIRARLRPEVLARARLHLARGDEVWLLSATADIVAQVLAEELGFTGARGTRFDTVEGAFTGRLDGPMLHAGEKAAAAAIIASGMSVDLRECWAYSDSYNDLPLLSAVGHPVLVHPDRALTQHARLARWPILRPSAPHRRGLAPGQHKKRQASRA
jgi:HAD superfamily hydrolase (TIGR01490 family)